MFMMVPFGIIEFQTVISRMNEIKKGPDYENLK